MIHLMVYVPYCNVTTIFEVWRGERPGLPASKDTGFIKNTYKKDRINVLLLWQKRRALYFLVTTAVEDLHVITLLILPIQGPETNC